MQPQIHCEILDKKKPWPPMCETKTFQNVDLMSFYIDRYEIDRDRSLAVGQNVIQGRNSNFNHIIRLNG